MRRGARDKWSGESFYFGAVVRLGYCARMGRARGDRGFGAQGGQVYSFIDLYDFIVLVGVLFEKSLKSQRRECRVFWIFIRDFSEY